MYKQIKETKQVIVKSYYVCDVCEAESKTEKGFCFNKSLGKGSFAHPDGPEVHLCPECTQDVLTYMEYLRNH